MDPSPAGPSNERPTGRSRGPDDCTAPERPPEDGPPAGDEAPGRRKPIPVRSGAPGAASERTGAAAARSRPTPVREVMGAKGPAGRDDGRATVRPVESEEAFLDVDGASYTVRVRGRGRSGGEGSRVPLLLLEFRPPGGDAPPREALVVGRSLAGLDPDVVREAWNRACPVRERADEGARGAGTEDGRRRR